MWPSELSLFLLTGIMHTTRLHSVTVAMETVNKKVILILRAPKGLHEAPPKPQFKEYYGIVRFGENKRNVSSLLRKPTDRKSKDLITRPPGSLMG